MILINSHSRAVGGAPVFNGLSQEELDRAYDQDAWAPDGLHIQTRILARSAEVARRTPPLSRRCGPGEKQVVDIFAPPAKIHDAPVFVMIHGGAWRLAMREAFYGPAPAIVAAGCILAVVGFECLPAVSMVEMAAQIRRALVWIGREIGEFGGNGRNLHLVGHSSGAHLAAAMMTTDWTESGLDPASLRGATLISGLYDLYPVMLSARGRYVQLTAAEVAALSPIRHLHRFAGSAFVAWGANESPEFKRQSQVFADALAGMGRLGAAALAPDQNHFEMLEALNDRDNPLTKAILAHALG
jgi:arylformamidase